MARTLQLLLRFVVVTAFGVLLVALIAGQMIPEIAKVPEAVSVTPRSNFVLPTLPEGSTIVDGSGETVGVLRGSENRIVVPLSEMSDDLKNTVLAVEDADFYEHEGVSVRSVLRAIRANSAAGEVAQGGSTITQQLVKLNLVGDDRTIERKIKEASLAIQLEDQLCGEEVTKRQCKDIILTQYLNQVYLGQGAYGVEAASRAYFGKSAKDVDLAEAALLAALVRNPTNYDPIKNPELARERRRVALTRMEDEGLVTAEGVEFIDALPLPSEVQDRTAARDSQSLSYIERKIRDELLEAEWLAPTEEERRYLIFNGGLKITSTIDPRAQELAEAAAADNPLAAANPTTVVGMAAVEPSTGAVRAIVGEVVIDGTPIEVGDPVKGERSGDGGFSSGSAYKPITLIAALEQGYTISDKIPGDPAPTKMKELWGVDRKEPYPNPKTCTTKGEQPLSSHLKASNNCAFMRLQSAVGFDATRETGIRLGLTAGPLDPDGVRAPCFTIGCDALVTPLGMAGAYATIANDGARNPAHFVERVEDRDGNVIHEWEPPEEQVIQVESARQATQAMEGVITGGTCTRCKLPRGQEAAGKTGTVEVEDGVNTGVWFAGFTPQMAAAVWIGDPLDQDLEDDRGLRGYYTQGGRSSGPIWQDFMAAYLEDRAVIDFADPERFSGGARIPDGWNESGKSDSGSRASSSTTGGRGNSRDSGDDDEDE